MRDIAVRVLTRALLVVSLAVTVVTEPTASSQNRELPSEKALQETLMGLEKQYWQAMKDHDAATLRTIMGPDGVFVDIRAAYLTTSELIDAIMRMTTLNAVFLPRVLIRRLGADAAVLAYDMKLRPDADTYAATAVYVRHGGQWVGIYHHEAVPLAPRQAAQAVR